MDLHGLSQDTFEIDVFNVSQIYTDCRTTRQHKTQDRGNCCNIELNFFNDETKMPQKKIK